MTPSKKVLIAATLLAAGYGVAALLGAPRPRLGTSAFPSSADPPGKLTPVTGAAAGTIGPQLVGTVRLLPDRTLARTDNAGEPDRGNDGSHDVPMTPAPAITAPVVAAAPARYAGEPALPLLSTRSAPRAKLKNESPRPLPDQAANQDRATCLTAWDRIESARDVPADSAASTIANSNVRPAGFAPDDAAAAPVTVQSVPMPVAATPQPAMVSPPPWPTEEAASPRTHVVIDGDTLAKLAGRYLDDPRRGDEIFALNRGVLTDPDLLPIGVELKIPPPRPAVGVSGVSPRWDVSDSQAIHAAAPGGLVPVRPHSVNADVMPRAQLLRPQPVE